MTSLNASSIAQKDAITEADANMNVIQALEIGESLCASEAEQVLAGEVRELREQLAQEKARLDWALETAATYYEWQGKHYLSYDVPENDGYEVVESDNPRATIDELIAAEAAGGGK